MAIFPLFGHLAICEEKRMERQTDRWKFCNSARQDVLQRWATSDLEDVLAEAKRRSPKDMRIICRRFPLANLRAICTSAKILIIVD